MNFIILLLMLLAKNAYAQNEPIYSRIKLLDVDEFSVDYEKFKDRRDPYLLEYTNQWRDRTTAKFNVNILDALYIDNRIHIETLDSGVVKSGGWEWFGGIRVFSWADMYYHHHSQHVLEKDTMLPDGSNTYPIEDSYGISIKLINDPKKRSLFK